MNLLFSAIPLWGRVLALTAIAVTVFLLGQIRGERIAGEVHNEYVARQASQTVAIAKGQTKVVVETQTKYVDRIKTIYIKGDQIEKQIPVYITAADDTLFGVNAGFVRLYNAAWTGDTAGPAADTDREPARIPLSEIAGTDAHNATSCLAWREQAIGLREFYEKLKVVTNGLQK